MTDLHSTLTTLLDLASKYPRSTRVLVNGMPINSIHFDAGHVNVPSIRIVTDIHPHLIPITNPEQLTGWRGVE